MARQAKQIGAGTCCPALLLMVLCGCATMKESDTARTGVEQLLISAAADRALDKIDLRAISGARVFVDSQYLDCVDKNYVLVSVHQRLRNQGCVLIDQADDAQVVLEIASGGVGTDRDELFFGIPDMSVPGPMPIAIPKIALFNRSKSMGTAKLLVSAYDTGTKHAVIAAPAALARSDHKNWTFFGAGPVRSGSLHEELVRATAPGPASDAPRLAQDQPRRAL